MFKFFNFVLCKKFLEIFLRYPNKKAREGCQEAIQADQSHISGREAEIAPRLHTKVNAHE